MNLERLCNWAISLSLPTGHADTVDDLLAEVGAHIRELQERANDLTAENERLRKALNRIATEDYRGPRPSSVNIAEAALRGEEDKP